MRKVYSPPPERPGFLREALLAGLLSLGVFLVLPLTQMVSSGVRRDLTLMKVDAAQIQTPEVEAPEPPPPAEEQPEEPPPPQLTDAPPPINLNVSLEVATGDGGAFGAGFGGFGTGDTETALDTFDVGDLERRPEAVVQVAPAYPAELRKARIEGTVTLVFVLSEEGRVDDARVENSSRPEFEKPALDAIRKWRFKPGMKDGQAVKAFMRLPLRFRLSAS